MPHPRDRLPASRLAARRRGRLSPLGDRARDARPVAGPGARARRSRCFVVAAFGDPGHAFPAIALARALRRRGHRVVVESWARWREAVESEGIEFVAAEEYATFPPPPPGARASTADAALALVPWLDELRPDVVVNDILTQAPALAAELAGLRRATLIPHVYPMPEAGLPFFSLGARAPRTALGRRAWRAALPALLGGLRRGRDEANEVRARIGLPPTRGLHGGISDELALVATLPQLEYPRRWPPGVEVTGPMTFELPFERVALPGGDEPLVIVAPSTAHDSESRLVRTALEALAGEPVRVLATTNRHRPGRSLGPIPANARVHDWVGYSQVMPAADLVVCHGGHGTLARALAAGAPVIACPAAGDMAENGARAAWAGAGLMLPRRLTRPLTLRAAARRVLGDPQFAARARAIARWARRHDGAERGAELVEHLAAR